MRDGKSRSLGKDFSACPSRVVLALLQDLLLGEHHDLLLLGEHHLDELLVVDVPLRVLLTVNQLLHLDKASIFLGQNGVLYKTTGREAFP